MEKAKRLSLTLPPDLHKKFKIRCVEADTGMTEFLVGLLVRELDRYDRQHKAKAAKTAHGETRA